MEMDTQEASKARMPKLLILAGMVRNLTDANEGVC